MLFAGWPIPSISASLAGCIAGTLHKRGIQARTVLVSDLPARDLIHSRSSSKPIAEALELINAARALVIAIPDYPEEEVCLVRVFLELLQENAFEETSFPMIKGERAALRDSPKEEFD